MTDSIRAAAIALYDRYTHEGLDRRAFMAELRRIAGGSAAASALIAAIGADPAAAAQVEPNDARLVTRRMEWPVGRGRRLKGYRAEPAMPSEPLSSVLVVHENRGLNGHIEDIARRLAVAGHRAIAADFLTPLGGTPADPDRAREMIGKLDLAESTADAVATLNVLNALPRSNGKVAIVGFCWGGAMVNRVAVAAGDALDAGICFYGPAPDPALASHVKAPLAIHLAERDERVNRTALPWIEALKAARKRVYPFVYDGTEHAFHNDTSKERYSPIEAALAWRRTLDFLAHEFGGNPWTML